MSDESVHEEFLNLSPGVSLYVKQWGTVLHARPLLVVHGAGEHVGRYDATATRLVSDGCVVFGFDQRGHGRSTGQRGHIDRFEVYLDDLRRVIEHVTRLCGGMAPVMVGHSLGGLIGTWYAIQYPATLRALALSSPLWGITAPIPWWKRFVAITLEPLCPRLAMRRPQLGAHALSHDPQVTARYLSDPLVHFSASLRLYGEIRRRIAGLPRTLPQLRLPLLVLQAGDDQLASAQAVRRLFPDVGSSQKQLIVYEGYYHEVFNEVGNERVFTDLIAWLRAGVL